MALTNVSSAMMPRAIVEGSPAYCDLIVESALMTAGALTVGTTRPVGTEYGASLRQSELFALCAVVVSLKVTDRARLARVMEITRHCMRHTTQRIPDYFLWALRRGRDLDPKYVGEVYQYVDADSLTSRAIAYTYIEDNKQPLLFYRT